MRQLRGVLIEVAAIVGEAGAWALVDRFGGREIHVPGPERIEAGHPLAMAIGVDAAKRFARRFEGPRFLVPNGRWCGPAAASVDLALARRLLADGASASVVAERVGVHLRTAWRLKARMRRATEGRDRHKSP